MKKALEPWLPREILYRPKMGFVTPISAWFRHALADEAAALARSPLLLQSGWFEPRTITRLAEDHRAGRAEHGRTLWQLVMLERSLARLFG
jgi:asparagine synthase (glutamine-hydrolysing)